MGTRVGITFKDHVMDFCQPRPMLVTFLVAVVEITDRNNSKRKGFVLVHSSRVTVHHEAGGVGSSWSRDTHNQEGSDECGCSAPFP